MNKKLNLFLGNFGVVVFLVVFLCAGVVSTSYGIPRAQAAAWSGIIDSSRAVDWSQAGVSGGIPNRTSICATLSPGATATQINSAIANCGSGQVVYLNAGTYNLSAGITFGNKNDVTLRGAGANATFLIFSASSGCNGLSSSICIPGSNHYGGGANNTATWTAGYAKGTTQVTLSSTANLVAGSSLITLDQLDDASDTGNIYVCQSLSCSTEGPSGGGRSGRIQGQTSLVTAINGSVVTLDPPLYMPNWRPSQSPGAWWANSIRTGDGIEDLSMQHATGGTSGIIIINAKNSWVKGVRS
ncbi:MAG: glycosyl hydrolase family 28-related protein, partial [bacterium]|nr:glycosyl hydrolase family 28-related protein [bacterium]